MSTHKYIDRICVAITICAVILTAVFMNGKALGIQAIVDEDAEGYEGSEYFTARDMDGTWDTADATVISLTGDGAVIQGEGVYTYDGDVYISAAGRYVLSGKLDDGSIVIDAYDSSKVYLMLDGVDITCSDDAGLKVEQADKVFVTLAEGSDNTVTSGAEYSDEALKDEVTGAVFAHDDLTVNGSGSLTVTAGYKHGIVGKDDVIITGGTIAVNAPADGIRANDSLRIANADITVEAGDDGIVINHEDGYFYMESGSLNVTGGGDGFHAAGDVTVAGGDITISAADDGIHSDTAFSITGGKLTISGSYEGIEAVTIDIAGGDTVIYSQDDGINANGGSGDMFGMGGGPGGMGGPGGGFGGMRDGSASRNGVSGNRMDRRFAEEVSKNGAVSDPGTAGRTDAAPAASGSENSAEDVSDEAEEETYVHISGGSLTIINESGQDADGIDSNGDLIITGGTVRVSLVNNGNNSALDYASESGGVAEISGGTLIACGNYSMAEQFDSSSSQVSFLYTYSEGAEAGTTVALEDVYGNVIMSYEVPQAFSSMNMSCPELKVGETYLVVIGDKVEEITLEEVSASYGDAASGGFGGRMNFGGMQSRGEFAGFGGG
ncbi:MAG: carbohydrate-binding domain-containing protein [Lachnospiraceae bacterium]|nr:carbohydrate-binding domain-containing protein [Lachnospiraceae bacterium]